MANLDALKKTAEDVRKAAIEAAAKAAAEAERERAEREAWEKAEREKAERERAGSRALPRAEVEAILDAKAKAKGMHSNWRDSLPDLMKTLDISTSLASRTALAAKLNYSGHAADGSAEKDMWLHARLFKALIHNGGELPPDIL